jgi:hypothetical protein
VQADLAEARHRIAAFAAVEADREKLRVELREVLKLAELQKADLDRYREELKAREPHRPERVPPDQLQDALARVLGSIGTPPANEDGTTATPPADAVPGTGAPSGLPAGAPPGAKRRSRHGRRPLRQTGLPLVQVPDEPAEVLATGTVGFRRIGQQISDQVVFVPGGFIHLQIVHGVWIRDDRATAEPSGEPHLATSSTTGTEATRTIDAPVRDPRPVAESTSPPREPQADARMTMGTEATATADAPVHDPRPVAEAPPSPVGDAARTGIGTPLREAQDAPTDDHDEEHAMTDHRPPKPSPPDPGAIAPPAGARTTGPSPRPSAAGPPPRAQILVAPLPESMWPRSMADPSAIAHIIVSKYDDCLPLHRQEQISERHGFQVPRSTQCSWLGAAWGYLARVVEAMFEESKAQAFCIATDATGAPVRARPKNEMWHVYVFIADRGHVVFRYDRDQNSDVLHRLLEGFHGYLLADAAVVYDILFREDGMTEVGCWAHLRRYAWEALGSDRQRAMEMLAITGRLFEIERACKDIPMPDRTRARADQARPVLDLLDRWIERERPHADPRGPLDAAFTYYRNQYEALHRFLEDGRLRIDNNISESELRRLVLGLNNFSFFANETGLKWYTTFRSLIASCRMHGLNAETYLEQVLRLARHWPAERVIELSPKYWRATVEQLDERGRRIITRPWELPGVDATFIPSPGTRAPGGRRVA